MLQHFFVSTEYRYMIYILTFIPMRHTHTKKTHQLQLAFYSFYPIKSSSECGFLLLYLSTIPAKYAQLSLKSRYSLVFLSKSTYFILYDQSAHSFALSLQLLIIKLCYLSQEKFRARAVLKKKKVQQPFCAYVEEHQFS